MIDMSDFGMFLFDLVEIFKSFLFNFFSNQSLARNLLKLFPGSKLSATPMTQFLNGHRKTLDTRFFMIKDYVFQGIMLPIFLQIRK